jgi:adenine-specific DNA-methyltransferase
MRDGLDLLHLTIKKMPNTVFTKCEWGHDDYSLQIKNLPKRII